MTLPSIESMLQFINFIKIRLYRLYIENQETGWENKMKRKQESNRKKQIQVLGAAARKPMIPTVFKHP